MRVRARLQTADGQDARFDDVARAGSAVAVGVAWAVWRGESFQAPRLQELQAKWKRDGVSASASLRRLAVLVDWMDSRRQFQVFAAIGPFFLLKTQFAFALEAWHARHGPMIQDWLMALGEMEALSSLAGYAYEHPADVFPELVVDSASPLIEAQGLAHPLIAESSAVRNDILLDSNQPLHVISGSNMSGKSTWLRAIGANLVLAHGRRSRAGARNFG
jgi:hypothetical protein